MSSRSAQRRPSHSAHRWRLVLVPLALAVGLLSLGSAAHADLVFDQIGEDLQGGPFVALSDNGERLAAGFPGRDGSSDVGVVRVYGWNGTAWSQLGADLQGEEPGDQFGHRVQLSSDGNRVAVGAWHNQGISDTPDGGQVRVFEWDGSAWTQLGSDIDGDTDSYYSGNDVELSADGNRVAVAGWTQVRIFDFDGSNWIQAGSYLPGGERGIAMSADGRRAAVGPTGGEGSAFVYDWNGSGWIPAGASLKGDNDFFNCCGNPTMSADGNRVTIAASLNPVTLTFDWDGSDWVRVGGDVTSWVWAMSDDGNRLASIDPVGVLDWDGSNWSQPSLLPAGDRLTALSADGSIVAAGIDSTIVRVYRITQAPSTTSTTTSTTTVAPTTVAPTTTPEPPATLPATGTSTALLLLAFAAMALGTGAVVVASRR
jgi:WD40 repeat protein